VSANFTPGPWRYLCGQVDAVTDGKPGVVVRRKIADVSIAHLSSGERDANAHLISAAPEQHVALASLVDQDVTYEGPQIVIRCDSHADAIERVRKARAALAKARGE
jgi:hypothetical protein